MSLTTSEMTPADLAAVTGNNNNDGMFGGNGAWWIIVLFLFVWGRGGYGFGGNDGGSGAMDNYVLASDFSMLSRQLSDGFNSQERKLDSISNGLCDGFYTQAQLVNGLNTSILTSTNAVQAQLADCCCKNQTAIAETNYNIATQANTIGRQVERGFADTNYNLATQNCATLTAIDKVGDRIIDYISTEKMQTLRDENQALRLAASQAKQNEYLIAQLGYQCPKPAYVVQPPQNVTFPTNCCGNVSYASGGCGCNG